MDTKTSSINSESIPTWNLDSIFPSIDSKEYKKALAEYSAGMENLSGLVETAKHFMLNSHENYDFPAWLSAYLQADDQVSALASTLNAYAYVVYSTDTTNTSALNNISTVEQLGLKMQKIDLDFRSILVSHQGQLEDFYKRFPEYEDFRFILNEEIEAKKHQMSAAEENLASDLQRTGGDAWDRLHEQIISNLKDEKGRTFNEIRNLAYSSDPAERKEAWQTEIKLLKSNEIAFAASLNNLKGETVTLNKRRSWSQAIDRALFSSRMSKKTLDALITAIEESLPEWRKYFQAKAAYLAKNKMTVSQNAGKEKGLAFYDLFAPVGQSGGKKWTFEEAKNYVIERYDSFSKEMGDFARHAFDSGWIDAKIRPGKVGGAYDEDFALGHQSRILSNFTGEFSDIITLAHEVGHAYHFSCLKGKRTAFFSYPMTLAETASTFAETIVKQDAIAKTSGDEKLKILELDLQDSAQVLVDILCRFYFERSVFEKRAKGELSAEDFNRLMREAQEKSYGAGLNSERHEYMWAVKSHYYSTGLDFYNFPYAFGQLFAAGLYERAQKEGPSFAKTYAELLSQTGQMSCEDLCKKAGFDISSPDFWRQGIKLYTKEISDFEKLVK